MTLTSRKINSFSKKVADLPDRPSPTFSASQIKSQFDSSPEELRVSLNAVVDDLTSATAGSSGAEQIGSAPITGVTGTTVYGQLSNLKTQFDTNANNFGKVTVVGQSDVVADAKGDTLNIAAGTGIAISTDPTTDTVTITAQGNAAPGAHASTHITGGSDVIPNAVANSNAGLLSGADKAKYDAVSVQGGSYGTTAGTGTAYTVTVTPTLAALTDGTHIAVKIHADNTGAATINVNGLGAVTIKKSNGNDVSSGNLKTNSIYGMRYNGTNFILQGEGGAEGNVTPDKVLTGTTYTDPASGNLTNGTMTNNGALTVTPNTTTQNFGTGYYTGVTVNPGGALSAGATSFGSITTNKQNGTTTMTKVKSFTAPVAGTYRTAFSLWNSSGSGSVNGRIYKNGSPLGTLRTTSSISSVSYTEDLSFAAGDSIELWLSGNGSNSATNDSFTLSVAPATPTLS